MLSLVAAPQQVECVKGCGDNDVVAIGLVVAMLSLAIAVAAWKITRQSLGIAKAEHGEFLKQLNARADFGLDIQVVDQPTPDGVIETKQDKLAIKWQVGIKKHG